MTQRFKVPLPVKLTEYFSKTTQFEIFNYRDSINLTIKNISEFSHMAIFDDQNEIDKYLEFQCSDNYNITFEQVPTEKILYPFTPGGNGNRCQIIKIFRALSLIDDNYPFFVKHEMFYASANSLNLICQCELFTDCMRTLEHYRNNTYRWPSKDCTNLDNLRLVEVNGVYRISNANHRICCAKRFNIPWVQAEVIHYSIMKSNSSNSIGPHRLPHFSSIGKNLAVLQSYRHVLQKFGLTADEGYQILINGFRGTALLTYLEQILDTDLSSFYHQLKHNPDNL